LAAYNLLVILSAVLLIPGLSWDLVAPFIVQIPVVVAALVLGVWISRFFKMGWLTPLILLISALGESILLLALGYMLPNILALLQRPRDPTRLSMFFWLPACLSMVAFSPVILGMETHEITCAISSSVSQCTGVKFECIGFPPRALVDITVPLSLCLGGVMLAGASLAAIVHRLPGSSAGRRSLTGSRMKR